MRAKALRIIVQKISSRETALQGLLPRIFAGATGPALEAAIFAAFEETRGVATEPLLLELLRGASTEVEAKVAHLLAWFGTAAAIEPLGKITGAASDAAQAAIGRIRKRVEGDVGALSLAGADEEGRLSVAHPTGDLSIAASKKATT